ncbi:MAG TPA: acyltransferase [Mycobacteriales bacterium]|nr:acyltransferase [Mycobacteriales bacterium]
MVASSPARAPRLDALTGLRFWFAFLVVVHHSLQHWFGPAVYPIADFGYIGVDFFFVLSGFVLTWSWRPDLPTGRFWLNRVARIWPLHLATLVLAVTFVADEVHHPGAAGTVANLFLVQAWVPGQQNYFGYNAVAWSLSCEVFFYLAFPVLVRRLAGLTMKRRLHVAAAVVVAMCIYPGLFSLTIAPHDAAGWEWTTYVLPLWRLGEFVIGIIAALAVRDGWRPRVRGGAALAVATCAAAGLLVDGLRAGHLPNRPFIEIVGMLVVAGVICAVAADELSGRRRLLSSRVMVSLGAASYALYLCHALLFGWVVHHWADTGSGVVRALGWSSYVAAAIVLSYLLHRLVEVPCERWIRSRGAVIWRKREVRATPAYGETSREREPELLPVQ